MAEYWCIGATTTRFFSVTSRIEIGSNSIGTAIAGSSPSPALRPVGPRQAYAPGRRMETVLPAPPIRFIDRRRRFVSPDGDRHGGRPVRARDAGGDGCRRLAGARRPAI